MFFDPDTFDSVDKYKCLFVINKIFVESTKGQQKRISNYIHKIHDIKNNVILIDDLKFRLYAIKTFKKEMLVRADEFKYEMDLYTRLCNYLHAKLSAIAHDTEILNRERIKELKKEQRKLNKS